MNTSKLNYCFQIITTISNYFARIKTDTRANLSSIEKYSPGCMCLLKNV